MAQPVSSRERSHSTQEVLFTEGEDTGMKIIMKSMRTENRKQSLNTTNTLAVRKRPLVPTPQAQNQSHIRYSLEVRLHRSDVQTQKAHSFSWESRR